MITTDRTSNSSQGPRCREQQRWGHVASPPSDTNFRATLIAADDLISVSGSRAYLEESIGRLDAKEPAPLLTREEFLAQTKALDE